MSPLLAFVAGGKLDAKFVRCTGDLRDKMPPGLSCETNDKWGGTTKDDVVREAVAFGRTVDVHKKKAADVSSIVLLRLASVFSQKLRRVILRFSSTEDVHGVVVAAAAEQTPCAPIITSC